MYSVVELLNFIIERILSGGRRTTADNTRKMFSDITNSTLNKKDGGTVAGVTQFDSGVILKSENNHRWKITIDDTGQILSEDLGI